MNELTINEKLAKEQADLYEVVPFHLAQKIPPIESHRHWFYSDSKLMNTPYTQFEVAFGSFTKDFEHLKIYHSLFGAFPICHAPNASELLRYMAGKGFGVYVCYATSELEEVPFEVEIVDKAQKFSQTYRPLGSENLAELLAIALIEFVLPRL